MYEISKSYLSMTYGDGCDIVIREPLSQGNPMFIMKMTVGKNCVIHIGRMNLHGIMEVFMADNCTLRIGDGLGVVGRTEINMQEPSTLTIGESCLISSPRFFTSDMHSIVSVETGDRVNPAQDIEIGDRVWVGFEVIVLKGARIGAGSVIGTRSIVTGQIPENCVAAGVPARVTKRGVTWRMDLI
jgi:acetyltransferase-like isoleucine patch superfamily enzyme